MLQENPRETAPDSLRRTAVPLRLAKSLNRPPRQVARYTVVAAYGLNLLVLTAPQRMQA